MGLRIFNTRSRAKEAFVPGDPREVRLYCCGPTVYSYAHIGNFRTFVFADLVRRYLTFRGQNVRHVMNITDVEDKIIAAVQESGEALPAYTERYEAAFFEDFDSLGCWRPHEAPRATAHIPEIIALIERLMAEGLAYQAGDRSIYFSIKKYQEKGHQYGQLLPLNLEKMRAGDRVSSDEYEKDAVADFALWKARVPMDGSVCWPSPWGEGRPGWHIECSAMSMKLLGHSFDLHLGGEDLIFPHHEDEIAQSEGARLQEPGVPFVRYWMHGAHLLVEGKKMSKSLGNYFTLRDLKERGFSGREIRYLLLTAHYRESFNFTLEGLAGARSALQRLDECALKLKELAPGGSRGSDPALEKELTEAMDDDLNVSAAWGAVFEWVRQMNRRLATESVGLEEAGQALGGFERVQAIFGVSLGDADSGAALQGEAPAEVVALLEARQAARKRKDFGLSDSLREELRQKGWVVEDTPKGPRLKRI